MNLPIVGEDPSAAAVRSAGRLGFGLAAYAILFGLLGQLALLWASGPLFSIFNPAAGLRFALLWHFGARFALPLAIAEASSAFGLAVLGLAPALDPSRLPLLLAPPLLYGVLVGLAKGHVGNGGPAPALAAVPMLAAAIVCPLVAAAGEIALGTVFDSAALPPEQPARMRAASVFALGDMTAIFLLAPPLVSILRGDAPRIDRLTASRSMLFELAAVIAASWAATALIAHAGLGIRLVPVMLGVVWAGLRAGRGSAWLAMAAAALVTLSITARDPGGPAAFASHLLLVAIAILGDLVGSFSDAQRALGEEVARRNRLLFHADRLRTLRAMSSAVIHEIGQPLSIISIESRHLRSLASGSGGDRTDLARSACLVEQKVSDLVELVRRLRRFGELAHGDAVPLAVADMVKETLAIARLEAAAKQVDFRLSVPDGLWIQGAPLELEQALLNLLRNAAQRAGGGTVAVSAGRLPNGSVHIDVENAFGPNCPRSNGMGIGLLVATSIVEAFGGTLTRSQDEGAFRVRLTFPGLVDG